MIGTTAMIVDAQTAFPSKPVKIIVPSAPGDGSDLLARMLAQKLSERWAQPVTVENRPGAGGVVGTEAAAKSAPDGYTVILGNAGSHAINQALYPKLPYDVTRDFAPISLVGSAPNVFVVNPGVPANTVAEFIALAKKEPGKYAFASGGNGSSAHLNGEMLKAFAGIEMTHVPYKGANPAITDVIGGQVQLMIGNLPPILPHIKSGKLRALGVTTVKRFGAVPDLAPVADTVPGYESLAWFGLFAPSAVAKDIVNKWHIDTAAVLALPDVKEKITQMGFDVVANRPDEFAAIVKSDIAKWQNVVKRSGAKAD
ncbi:MAG: tripartite tricarboxylate transporter substrate binding protein [Betaproteobacteria bacterium]|nr:MAG: tripartite tricarboxylate transporter substrate binding protein [Betaproteobacteria bacterium]